MPIAWRAASADRPAVVPPTWRSWMPVRSRIHSSLVSRPMSCEVLVGQRLRRQGGAPAGDHRAPGAGMDGRHAVSLQLVLSQAMGWRDVTRSVSTAM